MKITPDAAAAKIANLQAITATEGQLASAGKGATRAVVGASPVDPKALKAPVRTDPSLRPPVVGTPLVLSPAARQLAGPPPPATLAWAHQVVEALTGLKLPPPLPGRPLVSAPGAGPVPGPQTPQAPTTPIPPTAPGAAAMPASHGRPTPDMPAGTAPATVPYADTERALFQAQGQVFPDNGPEVDFSLQLFAERSADAPHVPPTVSPVLARMLGSHPLMPPLSLRFQAPAEQLQSAVFHFEVEPSVGDPAVPSPAAAASGPQVRLLGLLVLNPQMAPVYDMHVAGAAAPRTDPAAMMAAMGFHPLQQPPFGKVVLDVAASLICSDERCPFFGQGSCPQPGCRRHEWSDDSPLPPEAGPG